MTGRRSSARLAAQSGNSSPPQPQPKSSPAGKKRKNDAAGSGSVSSPSAKRGKKAGESGQQTLKETIQNGSSDQPAPEKPEETAEAPSAQADKKSSQENEAPQANGDAGDTAQDEKLKAEEDVKMSGSEEKKTEETQPPATENTKAEATDDTKEEEAPAATNGNAVVPEAREGDPPSSILEKGVIYFFFRSRVNVDDPQDVKDIARSYMVLRPIPLSAKIGEGAIGDNHNCRLLALPKKVLPRSGRDRFMTFVEKAGTSFAELKDSFLPGSDYATKTAGTSHSPPVTPLAEGVYAITSTGRESHLAYIITIPQELGEVQKDMGLRERGSFVVSVRNPTKPAPGGASLPKGPEYPPEILNEFRDLRWKPLEPKLIDFENAQFLVIGDSFEAATEQRPKDERQGNGLPNEELEELEGEDEIRIQHLKGDDSVFVDLGVSSKDFPKVPTTW